MSRGLGFLWFYSARPAIPLQGVTVVVNLVKFGSGREELEDTGAGGIFYASWSYLLGWGLGEFLSVTVRPKAQITAVRGGYRPS